MKIEHMEQQKNKLLVDKSAPDLNDMLCSLCQKNRGGKEKIHTFTLAVWGYHPA